MPRTHSFPTSISLPPAVMYRYMSDLPRLDACHPQVQTRPPSSSHALTPTLAGVGPHLATHPEQRFWVYIMDGLRFGFRLGFNYQYACQKSLRNMTSSLEQPQVNRGYLVDDCSEGLLLAPLDPTAYHPFRSDSQRYDGQMVAHPGHHYLAEHLTRLGLPVTIGKLEGPCMVAAYLLRLRNQLHGPGYLASSREVN